MVISNMIFSDVPLRRAATETEGFVIMMHIQHHTLENYKTFHTPILTTNFKRAIIILM